MNLFLSVFSFLTFPLSNKQTNKIQSHCDVSLSFYSLDMEIFVIYYFITQAAYIIIHVQMQTFKWMLIVIVCYTNHGDSQ